MLLSFFYINTQMNNYKQTNKMKTKTKQNHLSQVMVSFCKRRQYHGKCDIVLLDSTILSHEPRVELLYTEGVFAINSRHSQCSLKMSFPRVEVYLPHSYFHKWVHFRHKASWQVKISIHDTEIQIKQPECYQQWWLVNSCKWSMTVILKSSEVQQSES